MNRQQLSDKATVQIASAIQEHGYSGHYYTDEFVRREPTVIMSCNFYVVCIVYTDKHFISETLVS